MSGTKRLRMTRQRKLILEELKSLRTHPTADEVYASVRRRMPRISLGTVYRNLEVLSRSGLIQKLDSAGTAMRFDGFVEQHYHVRCIRCGKVEDVPVEPFRDLEEPARNRTDFKILGHQLHFFGVCPGCTGQDHRPEAGSRRSGSCHAGNIHGD